MTSVLLNISRSCKVGITSAYKTGAVNLRFCELCCIMQSCIRYRIIASFIQHAPIISGAPNTHMAFPLFRTPMIIVHSGKAKIIIKTKSESSVCT